LEGAIKALGPGINNPGTAVISLWALGYLLAYKLQDNSVSNFNCKSGELSDLMV